jgi:hypothetical protein
MYDGSSGLRNLSLVVPSKISVICLITSGVPKRLSDSFSVKSDQQGRSMTNTNTLANLEGDREHDGSRIQNPGVGLRSGE